MFPFLLNWVESLCRSILKALGRMTTPDLQATDQKYVMMPVEEVATRSPAKERDYNVLCVEK